MTQTSIATSADYAEALLVARRGKHVIFLILLLMLLAQIAIFFVARYTDILPSAPLAPPTVAAATTSPATTVPAALPRATLALNYLTSATTFFGTVLPILLAFDLLLILNIMLVGRLLGLARTTSAFLWCLLLMLLMFPIQLFFGEAVDARDFRLPGLLYGWNELVLYAKFPTEDLKIAVLKWTRFVVAPLAAIVLLSVVQIKSNRGLRQALGEATPELT